MQTAYELGDPNILRHPEHLVGRLTNYWKLTTNDSRRFTMARLDGKVALMSGGARGQGAAEALLLAKEGAKVVIGDILDNEGGQVKAQIAKIGGVATYVHLDVTSGDDWDTAVQTALDRYGRLDILVNNAGILGGRTGLEETTSEQWDAILEVNARAHSSAQRRRFPRYAMRAAAPSSTYHLSQASSPTRPAYPLTRRARARAAS